MFRRDRNTTAASQPSFPSTEPAPHHVPDWIANWDVSEVRGTTDLAALLNRVHADLLDEAERGPGRSTYAEAARVVSDAACLAGTTFALRDEGNITESLVRALGEVIRVLRDWDPTTTKTMAFHQFDIARGWASNARNQTTALISRRSSAALAEV